MLAFKFLPILTPLLHFSTISPSGNLRFPGLRRRRRSAVINAHLRFLDKDSVNQKLPPVVADTLRLLEWDKLCQIVSAFAGTPLGRSATLEQLWAINVSFEDSKQLLSETTAAVEMVKCGLGGIDFAGLDLPLVQSAIDSASRGFPVSGMEALAVSSLVQFAENLQMNLKTTIKEDADLHQRFMPLTEVVIDFVICRELVKSVQQVIEEDGSVKDSASSELKHARAQVKATEKKLYQLMDKLARKEKDEASSMEVCVVNGRWCIKAFSNQVSAFDGLLLSSASDGGILEPVAAVPLNDELQRLRAFAAKAEDDVLSRLTDKVVAELDGIIHLLDKMIWLDAVFARAKYSIAYGGNYPDLYLPSHAFSVKEGGPSAGVAAETSSLPVQRKQWKLYIPKAYHPLLLQHYRENLSKAKRDIANITAEIRRKRLQGKMEYNEDRILASLKLKVEELETNHPVAVDFMISTNTNVLVVTGPNTGGKTISLKSIGLASTMAKSGLYVLASEPIKIPWFDAIYADIGDEQSLTQSLSTFSGHLKQISAIRSHSSDRSLVLLDEVGAGTNPLEGAALGMAILESFADNGAFLTIATTHHGELKTLKYNNTAFENACVEFDEESLKPTYRILWGIPGRSNAINIAKRLGLPSAVLESAFNLYGVPSAKLDEVIMDMERHKHDFQQNLQEAEHYLRLSKELHEHLLTAKENIIAHGAIQRNRMVKAISDTAAIARSILRNKLQQFRESTIIDQTLVSTNNAGGNGRTATGNISELTEAERPTQEMQNFDSSVASQGKSRIPEVGDMVFVPTLRKQAKVVEVETSKGVVFVQAGNIKLRLNVKDIRHQQTRKN